MTANDGTSTRSPQHGLPVVPESGVLSPLGGDNVTIDGGFWARLQKLNAEVMIPHAEHWMEKVGWIGNFDAAVEGRLATDRTGREFSDSDVYKLMEAMAWEIGRTGNEALDAQFRALTARIAPVQEEDGYLNTKFGRPGQEPRYSNFEWGHELYCYGHMFQAAVARLRTTGRDEFVDIALRAADHVCREFGADGRKDIPGHPEIETALAELARATGERRYAEQAQLFVERRGHHTLADIEWGRTYFQDEVPVREIEVAHGHSVRAMYFAAGAADVAVATDDQKLLDALVRQADATIARRTYITGGMGARHQDEAFGDDFQLPPDRAYSETCAGIAAVQFFQRLLLATGEVRWADHIERILYNVLATSPAEDGRGFFYANTLFRREPGDVPSQEHASPRAESSLRAPWYDVSCCPTNVARTLASLNAYVATTSENGVQVHQYVPGTITASVTGGDVRLRVETDYPRGGEIVVSVEEAPASWTLSVRVPAWARGASLTRGAETVAVEPGVVELVDLAAGEQVVLSLTVQAHWVFPDARIDAVLGQVAVQRGPIVYCLESVDLDAEGLGTDVGVAGIDVAAGLRDEGAGEVWAHVAVRAAEDSTWPYSNDPRVAALSGTSAATEVRLVPYHSWGNRGPATMRVWVPRLDA